MALSREEIVRRAARELEDVPSGSFIDLHAMSVTIEADTTRTVSIVVVLLACLSQLAGFCCAFLFVRAATK